MNVIIAIRSLVASPAFESLKRLSTSLVTGVMFIRARMRHRCVGQIWPLEAHKPCFAIIELVSMNVRGCSDAKDDHGASGPGVVLRERILQGTGVYRWQRWVLGLSLAQGQ